MKADEIDTGPGDGLDSSRSHTRWWAVVAFVVAGVAIVHLAALIGNRGPILYSDALGYLGNARFLAGGAPPTFDGSFSYSPGYSVLLVPLYWFTQRSDIIWTGSVLLNAAFATLIMAPAYKLARQMFSLERYPALLSAAAVSLTPALILQPGRIWVETLFPLVFLLAVVAVTSMFGKGNVISAVTSGVLVGYLVSVHGRGIAVAAALGAVLLIGVLWRQLRIGVALLAVVMTGLVVATDLALRSYLRDQLWTAGDVPANAGSVARIVRAYAPDQLASTLTTGLGHLWYVIAVSFGLAAVGIVALLFIAADSARWHPTSTAVRAGALFAVLAVAGVFFLSAGLLTNVNRVDHRVYGRYLEGVTPILILAGAASLLKVRVAWRVFAYGAATILVAGLALYWTRGSGDFVGNVQKFTIPGLVGMQSIVERSSPVFLDGLSIVAISVLATVVGIAAAFAIRSRPFVGVVAVLAFTVGITFVGKVTSWDPFVSFWYDAYNNVPTALRDLPQDRSVAYDVGFLDPDARSLYEFRLAPRQLIFVAGVCEADPGGAVISTDDPEAAEVGATLLAADAVPGQALWLLPEDPASLC